MDSFRKSMDLFRFISTVFKRFVLRIHFGHLFSKGSVFGFVSDICFQKVRFVDSFHSMVFKGFDLFFQIQRILPKRNKSLLHKHTLKDLWCSKDSFCGFVSPTVFNRFVLWICFGHLFSNYPFRGFVSDTCFQITHFVDSFWEKKAKKVWFVLFRKYSCTNPASLYYIRFPILHII